ncbi:collagen alpha-2(I) chain-like, partial [Sipha flava]|uniref:Collagen alpha-2(I) chain-like n=1 Tax=Sipha flava TaxID=143950 RepID=A0A8B8F4U7_9HEMI
HQHHGRETAVVDGRNREGNGGGTKNRPKAVGGLQKGKGGQGRGNSTAPITNTGESSPSGATVADPSLTTAINSSPATAVDPSPAAPDSTLHGSPNHGHSNPVGETGPGVATTSMPAGGGPTPTNNGVDRHAVEGGIPGPATVATTRATKNKTGAPGALASTATDAEGVISPCTVQQGHPEAQEGRGTQGGIQTPQTSGGTEEVPIRASRPQPAVPTTKAGTRLGSPVQLGGAPRRREDGASNSRVGNTREGRPTGGYEQLGRRSGVDGSRRSCAGRPRAVSSDRGGLPVLLHVLTPHLTKGGLDSTAGSRPTPRGSEKRPRSRSTS